LSKEKNAKTFLLYAFTVRIKYDKLVIGNALILKAVSPKLKLALPEFA